MEMEQVASNNEANEWTGAKQTERGKNLKNTERGQNLRRAVGMAGKKASRQTKPAEQGSCRQTQPADSPSGTGLKTNGPQLAGGAAKTTSRRPGFAATTPADDVLPLAMQVSGGVQRCWHSCRRAQTCLSVPTPPIAFACHCPYPLP